MPAESQVLRVLADLVERHGMTPADLARRVYEFNALTTDETPVFVLQLIRKIRDRDLSPDELANLLRLTADEMEQ